MAPAPPRRFRLYVDLLRERPGGAEALSQDLLIIVTSFFRDPGGLEALSVPVFPALMARRSPKRSGPRLGARLLDAARKSTRSRSACSSASASAAAATPIQIFGTDVSDDGDRAGARRASIPDSIAADVSPERLRRFFLKADGGYRISKASATCASSRGTT